MALQAQIHFAAVIALWFCASTYRLKDDAVEEARRQETQAVAHKSFDETALKDASGDATESTQASSKSVAKSATRYVFKLLNNETFCLGRQAEGGWDAARIVHCDQAVQFTQDAKREYPQRKMADDPKKCLDVEGDVFGKGSRIGFYDCKDDDPDDDAGITGNQAFQFDSGNLNVYYQGINNLAAYYCVLYDHESEGLVLGDPKTYNSDPCENQSPLWNKTEV
eukprot:TRINITY_DN77575_c0_g1_i1.p3 TRINITY_DN77575_c0_g1~~TRINITY_DN77575_c0_g1_i1.p3  ORF type:complete len:223 (-),score=36.21 TRINITY_DN77575_c0_g1_i1:243-911(-)